jgi:hypothetical protein
VCVFVPAGGALLASLFTGGIAYEVGPPNR